MYLKKADEKKNKQIIKGSKTQKILSFDDVRAVNWAWRELEINHFRKIRLDLDHIGKLPLIDSLEADCIDGETLFNTKSYMGHYSDWELNRLLNVEIPAAKRGIAYIENLAREEEEKRKGQSKSINYHKREQTRKESGCIKLDQYRTH